MRWQYTSYSRRAGQGGRAAWRRAQARARHDRQESRWYLSGALPLYGLPPGRPVERSTAGVGLSWPGTGWRAVLRRARVDRLALAHRLADGGLVTVSSHRAAACARFIDATAIEDLSGPPGKPQLPGQRDGPQPATWRHVTILVDSQPVIFRMLAKGSSWVALTRLGDIYLKVHASGLPVAAVSLVGVSDVRPYPPGSETPAPPAAV